MIDIVKEYEQRFAENESSPNLAGGYSGLGTYYARKEHFLGLTGLEYGDEYEKVALIDCQCGGDGCWPFAIKITVVEGVVGWSDFEQPHRLKGSAGGHWDYSNFGPFNFDLQQYQSEISKIDEFAGRD